MSEQYLSVPAYMAFDMKEGVSIAVFKSGWKDRYNVVTEEAVFGESSVETLTKEQIKEKYSDLDIDFSKLEF